MGTNTLQGPPSTTPVTVDFSSTANQTIVAGVAGQRIQVYKVALNIATTTVLTFKDGSTELWGGLTFTGGGDIVLDITSDPWFTTSTGNSFVISCSATTQVSGGVYYVLMPPCP